MRTTLTETPLAGLLVVETDCFQDERGFFTESWNARDFRSAGLDASFVQDNHSRSARNVIRGLHYQDARAPVGKLVRCTRGTVYDVAVDLRAQSPTFGQWYGLELSAGNRKQLWIPAGFAHGFAALEDACEVQYKQTGYYRPDREGGIVWNDPDLAIAWPVAGPILSDRDRDLPRFADYRKNPAFP